MFSEYEAHIAEHHRNMGLKRKQRFYQHLQAATRLRAGQRNPSRWHRILARLRGVRSSATFDAQRPSEEEMVVEGLEPC